MKTTLTILFLFIIQTVYSTPEITSKIYSGKNIEIELIIRYENDIQDLYYQALIKDLDKLVGKMKEAGKLDRGKIHLEILTAIWMEKSTGVEMYRYKKGYYCWLNGLVQSIDRDYLVKVIHYFASENWESFSYDTNKISPKTALNIFNQRLDSAIDHNFDKINVLSLNSVNVDYINDKLTCSNTETTYGEIDKFVPFSKDIRDFIAIGETIFVIENQKIINQIELADNDFTGELHHPCSIEVLPKWINFKNSEGYFLSYSYDENKFHKI